MEKLFDMHSSPNIVRIMKSKWGQGSSVGIMTRYRLEGPGIDYRRGEIFRNRSDRPWGPPGYRVFPGGKAAWAWLRSPTTSNTEVKGRVELYIYSPLGLRGLF
jgi:hypothetical protein